MYPWCGTLVGLERHTDLNGSTGTALQCCVLPGSNAVDGSSVAVQLGDGSVVVFPQRCFRRPEDGNPALELPLSSIVAFDLMLGDDVCWMKKVTTRLAGTAWMCIRGNGAKFEHSYAKARGVGGMLFAQTTGKILYTSHHDACLRAYGPSGEERVVWRSESPGMLPITHFIAAGEFIAGLRASTDTRGTELLVLRSASGDVAMKATFSWPNLPWMSSIALWPSPYGGFVVFYGGSRENDFIVTLTDHGKNGWRSHCSFGSHIAGVQGDTLCTYSQDAVWLSDISVTDDGVVGLRHNCISLERGISRCAFSERRHIAVLYANKRSVLFLKNSQSGYRPIWLHGHQIPPERALFVSDSLVTACVSTTFRWPLTHSARYLRAHGVRADLYTRMLLLACRRLPQDVVEAIVSLAVNEIVHFVPYHVV